MATRSNIGVKTSEGKYKVIYCHWDGYPSYNGKVLLENYNTQEKVEELIEMGDISVLREKIGEKHHIDSVEVTKLGYTTFYHRDIKEKLEDTQSEEFDTLEELLGYCINDYTYIFDNGKWLYRHWEGELKELTPEVCGIKEEVKNV